MDDRRLERVEQKLDRALERLPDHHARIRSLETWREKDVDPALNDMREARGGLKGFKLGLSLLAAGAGGGVISKLAAAFIAGLPR